MDGAFSFNLPFRRMARRATNKYKSALSDYLDTMQQALAQDTQSKLVKLRQRSVQILLESYDKRQIDDFSVEHLASTRAGDRIIVTSCKTKKQVACGTVVSVQHDGEGKSKARIRLHEPIVINFKSDKLKKMHEEDTRDGELVALASKQEFKLKFDEAQILSRRDKIERALARFKSLSCSLSLHKNLLGNYKDSANKKFNRARVQSLSPELSLKGSQIKAVEESMKRRISLIEGVAGSGKSLVAATLANSMSRFRGKRVLICSPMQTTIDMVAKLLQENVDGIKVVKLPSESSQSPTKRRPEAASQDLRVRGCSLEQLVRAGIYQRAKRRATRALCTDGKEPSSELADRLHRNSLRVVRNSSSWLRRKVQREVLAEADVVCCTLLEAGSATLRDQHFDMLIIDDLQAASEADCIIPLMAKGIKQVTLIGEMRRDIRMALTKPLAMSESVGKIENSRPASRLTERSVSKFSPRPRRVNKPRRARRPQKNACKSIEQPQELGGLFERLLNMGLSSVALRSQFRMHQNLAIFPNLQFYLSKLKTDKQTNENLEIQMRTNESTGDEFDWLPRRNCLTAFFDMTHATGRINDVVQVLVSKLLEQGIRKSSIGVLTNKSHLVVCENVKVGTVEDFYGLECDYVILVAQPKFWDQMDKETGSLIVDYTSDNDALLIAITRARLGMFVVAEMHRSITENEDCQSSMSEKRPEVPSFCENWTALVRHYLTNDLSVDGSTFVENSPSH